MMLITENILLCPLYSKIIEMITGYTYLVFNMSADTVLSVIHVLSYLILKTTIE